MPIIRRDEQGQLEIVATDLDTWNKNFRRVLLHGPPLSGKSTALTTFPRPAHVLVAPGELGHSSLRETKDFQVYQFEFDPADELKFADVWADVQAVVADILTGNCGKVETFAIDGLHKLYYLIQKAMHYKIGTDAREFAKYHEAFRNFLQPILASAIPMVVATCYDGQENTEDPKQKMTIYPALPGMMAKEIMGSFPATFHTVRNRANGQEEFKWQLRATDKVQGVGIHVPVDISQYFPEEIEPSWVAVEQLIKEVNKKDGNTTASKKDRGQASASTDKNKHTRTK